MKNKLTIILAVALAMSLGGNGYFTYQLNQSTISFENQLTILNEEIGELQTELDISKEAQEEQA